MESRIKELEKIHSMVNVETAARHEAEENLLKLLQQTMERISHGFKSHEEDDDDDDE